MSQAEALQKAREMKALGYNKESIVLQVQGARTA